MKKVHAGFVATCVFLQFAFSASALGATINSKGDSPFLAELHLGIKTQSVDDTLMTEEASFGTLSGVSLGWRGFASLPRLTLGLRMDVIRLRAPVLPSNVEASIGAFPVMGFADWAFAWLQGWEISGGFTAGMALAGRMELAGATADPVTGEVGTGGSAFTLGLNFKAKFPVPFDYAPTLIPYAELGWQRLSFGEGTLDLVGISLGGFHLLAGVGLSF